MNKVGKCLIDIKKYLVASDVEYRVSPNYIPAEKIANWFIVSFKLEYFPDTDILHKIAKGYGLNSRSTVSNLTVEFEVDDFPF